MKTRAQSGEMHGRAYWLPALLAAVSLGGLVAQPVRADEGPGYVTSSGGVVVDSSGDCVRTSEWDPNDHQPYCNPAKVAQKAPPPQPEPVAQKEPAPEPKRVVRRVTLQTDTLFDFDKAQLSPRGRELLDAAMQKGDGLRDLDVTIIGYTDKIGTREYNQGLSKRRADAVRDYLVSKGLKGQRVSVQARGENNPVVSCPHQRGEELIDCLAPNRRAEVEFAGFETEVIEPAQAPDSEGDR